VFLLWDRKKKQSCDGIMTVRLTAEPNGFLKTKKK
jgi:hypothetical protein